MPRTIPQRGGPSGLKRSTAGPSSSSSSALRAQTGGKTAFGRGKTTLGAGKVGAKRHRYVYSFLFIFLLISFPFGGWYFWNGTFGMELTFW